MEDFLRAMELPRDVFVSKRLSVLGLFDLIIDLFDHFLSNQSSYKLYGNKDKASPFQVSIRSPLTARDRRDRAETRRYY